MWVGGRLKGGERRWGGGGGRASEGRGGSGLAGMHGLVGSVLAWPGESRDTQSPARKENAHARARSHARAYTQVGQRQQKNLKCSAVDDRRTGRSRIY